MLFFCLRRQPLLNHQTNAAVATAQPTVLTLDILEGNAQNIIPTTVQVGQTQTVKVVIENSNNAPVYNQFAGVSLTLRSQNGHFTVSSPTYNVGTFATGTATATWQITGISAGSDALVISASATSSHKNLQYSDSYLPNPSLTVTSAPTPTPSPIPTPSPTPVPTATPTPTPSPAPVPTATPTTAPTASPTPRPTPSPTSTPAPTPTPTQTQTPIPTVTETPTPPSTSTKAPGPSSTPTSTPPPTQLSNPQSATPEPTRNPTSTIQPEQDTETKEKATPIPSPMPSNPEHPKISKPWVWVHHRFYRFNHMLTLYPWYPYWWVGR